MYQQKTYIYGNRIEIDKHYTWRCYNRNEGRQPKTKPTPEAMKKRNDREAIRKLSRLLIQNFTESDWHLVLTYRPENRPDQEGAKKELNHFLRKLRREYKKHGEELRYIVVTEFESKNIHHHIVLNGISDMSEVINACWEGGKHFTPLYQDKDFGGLAEYLTKETRRTFDKSDAVFRKRYYCSKNLRQPVVKVKQVDADSWRKEPKVPARLVKLGYVLDKNSVEYGVNEMGYGYQRYILIRYQRRRP